MEILSILSWQLGNVKGLFVNKQTCRWTQYLHQKCDMLGSSTVDGTENVREKHNRSTIDLYIYIYPWILYQDVPLNAIAPLFSYASRSTRINLSSTQESREVIGAGASKTQHDAATFGNIK